MSQKWFLCYLRSFFIFKLYSNTIMKKGLIFILCRNMITTKGFKFKWDSKVVWFHIWHSQLLWILLATIISRQLCQLFLLWILLGKVIFSNFSEYPKVIFLQLRRNFQTFPLVIRTVLSFLSEYVQFSFELMHLSAFQVKFNHGKNIDFVDNKTLWIASQQCNAMALLCNTLLCLVLAIFLQKQKSLHGTASV